MNQSMEIEVKVGIFVALGTFLIALAIILLGGAKALFTTYNKYHVKFEQVDGVVAGAAVKMSGVKVGQVEKILFIKETGQVDVFFSVKREFGENLKMDAMVGIRTQGMLGDKYLMVNTGNPNLASIDPGSELRAETAKELKDYLSSADEVIDKLKHSLANIEGITASFNKDARAEQFFKNMAQMSSNLNYATTSLPKKIDDLYSSMSHMKSVMSKVDRGEGTLGALVNDPSLYEDLKALMGGANRNKVLKYFVKKSVENSRENQPDDKKQ